MREAGILDQFARRKMMLQIDNHAGALAARVAPVS